MFVCVLTSTASPLCLPPAPATLHTVAIATETVGQLRLVHPAATQINSVLPLKRFIHILFKHNFIRMQICMKWNLHTLQFKEQSLVYALVLTGWSACLYFPDISCFHVPVSTRIKSAREMGRVLTFSTPFTYFLCHTFHFSFLSEFLPYGGIFLSLVIHSIARNNSWIRL